MKRLSTGIKIHGTKSFRLACVKLLNIYGVNLQNPPEALLRCLTPSRSGYVFCQVDQSGAESVVVAYEAEKGLYRQLIEAGIKPHVYIALHIFIDHFRDKYPRDRYWKRLPEELKSLPEWPELEKKIKNSGSMYALGKMTNHARSYKMKWPTFQLSVLKQTDGRIALSAAEAKEFLQTWDDLFPEVIAWQGKIEYKLAETRELRNIFHYPRRFYGILSDALVREAISWIPQSSVACITHIAYKKVFDYIEQHQLPWMLLGQKHDSYYLECPESDAQKALKVMQDAISSLDLHPTTDENIVYHMKSEGGCGRNLGKFDEKENPEGLK